MESRDRLRPEETRHEQKKRKKKRLYAPLLYFIFILKNKFLEVLNIVFRPLKNRFHVSNILKIVHFATGQLGGGLEDCITPIFLVEGSLLKNENPCV